MTDTKQIYTCYTDTNFNFKLYIIIFSYFHPSCQLSFDLYDWSYGGDTLQLIPCRCPAGIQVGGEVFWVLILFLDVSEITKTRSYFGLPVETKIGKYEIGKNAKMIFEICKNAKMKFESWQKRIKVKTN